MPRVRFGTGWAFALLRGEGKAQLGPMGIAGEIVAPAAGEVAMQRARPPRSASGKFYGHDRLGATELRRGLTWTRPREGRADAEQNSRQSPRLAKEDPCFRGYIRGHFGPSNFPTLISTCWSSMNRADAVLPEFAGHCVEWSSVRVAVR